MRLDLFVILALATYRVWHLIARDSITERWREQVYNRWPPDYERALARMEWNAEMREMVRHSRHATDAERGAIPTPTWLAKMADCPWCAGAWLAAAATIAADITYGLPWPAAWFLALSAAVGLLGRLEGAQKAKPARTPAR